jgi:hypothetical protein
MAKKSDVKPAAPARLKSSALLDTRAIYCGDNLVVKPCSASFLAEKISQMLSCRASHYTKTQCA